MKKNIHLLIFLLLAAVNSADLPAQSNTYYSVENGAITGNNTGRYNNRPLYINNTNAFILTGDQPIARLAKDQFMFGTFMLAVERNGKTKWLQQCQAIKSVYRPGKMGWEVSDAGFEGVKLSLEVLPMAQTTGMAVRLVTEGLRPGDQLIWAFGGAKWFENQNLSWKMDVMGQPELLSRGFVPEECKNNSIELNGGKFLLSLTDENASGKKLFSVAGSCSMSSELFLTDASKWNNPTIKNQSAQHDLPLLVGKISPENNQPVYWAFEAFQSSPDRGFSGIADPETAFAEGTKRTDNLEKSSKINTPNP